MNILLLFLAILICYGVFWEIRRRSKRRARIADREMLSEDEIYMRYYADSGLLRQAVAKYWNEVARLLGLPAGHLRPSDRFDIELAPVRGAEMSDELEELGDFLEEEKQRLGLSVELGQIKTVDELVRIFAAAKAT